MQLGVLIAQATNTFQCIACEQYKWYGYVVNLDMYKPLECR